MANLISDLGGADGFGTNDLPANDDGSTGAIDITSIFPDGLDLFGNVYDNIYINNNGNITFTSPHGEYTPTEIGTGYTSPIIAPFWADVDTDNGPVAPTGGGSAGSNLVWYDLDTATDQIIITWDDVGYYTADDKVNAFQLVLTAEPDGNAEIEFIYQTVEWVAGDASGGTDGLGGTLARIGYSAGDGTHYYEIPESANQAALLALPTTIGNTGTAGVFVFQIDAGNIITTGPASSYSWNSGDTGLWSTAADWTLVAGIPDGGFPQPGDAAIIDSGSVQIVAASFIVADLSLGGSLSGPVGSSEGTLSVLNGNQLQITAALALWNGSTLSVDSASDIDLGSAGSAPAGSVLIENGYSLLGDGVIKAAVVNDGTIDVTNSATLADSTGGYMTIAGAVTGDGTINLEPGAILQVGGTLGAGQTVDFAPGTPETLVLGDPGAMNGVTIIGFSEGDKIDFANGESLTANPIVANGNTVTVTVENASDVTSTYVFTDLNFAVGTSTGFGYTYDHATDDYDFYPTRYYTWTGATSTDLGVASNWSPAGVPLWDNETFSNTAGGALSGTTIAEILNFYQGNWTLAPGANLLAQADVWIRTASLTIGTGSTVTSDGAAFVGSAAGSNGTLIVSGGGLLQDLSAPNPYDDYQLEVGEVGAANSLPASTGTVIVTGAGSEIDLGLNGMDIGDNGGTGTVIVSDGGTIIAGTPTSNENYSIAIGRTGDGTLTVTGRGSEVEAVGEAYVSHSETGSLTVENFGTFLAAVDPTGLAGLIIGAGAETIGIGGLGTVNVTTDGVLDSAGFVYVGDHGTQGDVTVSAGGEILVGTSLVVGVTGNAGGPILAGEGSLSIEAGGTVELTGTPSISSFGVSIGNGTGGASTPGNGVVTVSGAGALLDTNGSGLGVGSLTSGTLLVSQGGTVLSGTPNSTDTSALAVGRDGIGSVTVTGVGSDIIADGFAYIGRAGTGNLLIENSANMTVGSDPSGRGSLSIGGVSPTNTGTFYVGGSGTADVTTGGTIVDEQNLYVGTTGASGLLTISDATTPLNNGTVDVADQILIGNNATLDAGGLVITNTGSTPNSPAAIYHGFGTINVDAGGLLESKGPHVTGQASIDVGEDAGSTGTLNVAGTGAMVDAGGDRIDIGNDGTGVATISDGGAILSGADYTDSEAAADIGSAAGSSGTLTVTGAGSRLDASGLLDVGDLGAGTLAVKDQGLVAAAAFDTGVGATGSGATTITGAGSEMKIAGKLTVGDGANATLDVYQAATATAGSMDIGETAGAVGRVDIEDPDTLVQVAGDLNVGVAGTGYLSVGADAVLSVGGNVTVSAISTVIGYGGIIDPQDYDNAGTTYGPLDVEASGAIVNTGTFVAEVGTLELNGTVNGAGGYLLIDNAGTLQLDGSVAATQTVQFDTASGVLDIKDPTQFAPVIQDYVAGDEVDVTGIAGLAAPTYSDAGGDTVLTWSNGITLTFAGAYASGSIDVQPDPAPPPAPLPASLTFTVAQALAAYADGSLPADAEITDSSYQVNTHIDALQTLAAAGALAGISLLNSGQSNVAITPTQLTADAGVLALIDTPYQLVQIIDAADVASTVLATGFVGFAFVDTAANLVASLATLEALWKTGQLLGLRLTDSGSPVLDLTAAQVSADSDVLAMALTAHSIKLTDGGTPTITLSPWSTYTSIFTNVLARITSPYTLAASDAIRPVTIAAAEDGVDRFAAEDGPLSAAATSSGPTPNPSVLPGGLVVVDYQLNITSYLDSLEAAAADGKIASILLRDSGPQVLSITLQQYADDQAAIALLSPNHTFSEIITAAQAATATRAGLPAGFTAYTIQDSAVNIVANLDAINGLVREGLLTRINPTQAGSTFYLSAAELGRDAYALTYAEANYNIAFVLTDAGTPTVTISADLLSYSSVRTYVLNTVIGNYSLAVTGEVSFSTAAAIANENNKVLASLSAPLSIADYAGNLVSNLSALETLAADGKLGSITLLDGGEQTLSLSSAQQTAAAAVLADIVSPYKVSTYVSGSPATIAGELDSLEAQVAAGTLGGIQLTGSGTQTLTITAATLSADALAISRITTPYTIALTGGAPYTVTLREWQATDYAIANVLGKVTTPFTLDITDTLAFAAAPVLQPLAADIGTKLTFFDYTGNVPGDFAALKTLAQDGDIASITLSDSAGAFVPVTQAQATTYAAVLALITTPHTLSLVIAASAAAAPPALPAGFASYTVEDTAANIAADLGSIAALAATHSLAAIELTDVNVLPLSAAQIQANALALSFLRNQTTIVLTDSGTPTITLSGGELTGNLVNNVLARIQGSYHLAVTGAVQSYSATALVGAGGSVLSSLTTPLTVLDYSGSLASDLPALQTIAAAGLLSAINLSDGDVADVNLTSGEATADATALSKITSPYTLGVTTPTPVSGSSATIVGELDTLQAEAAAGTLANITLTDGGTPVLMMSSATLLRDYLAIAAIGSSFRIVLNDGGTPTLLLTEPQAADYHFTNALGRITSPFTIAISDTVGSYAAADLSGLINKLSSGLTVLDYSGNVSANIDALEALAQAGRLTSITLTDGTEADIAVTQAQATADAGALAKIVSPYALTLSLTAQAAAALTAVPAGFAGITVNDTAANVVTYLSSLETLAVAGTLVRITLPNGPPTNVLPVSAATLSSSAYALSILGGGPYVIQLTDTGTPTVTLSSDIFQNYSVLHNVLPSISGTYKLTVTGPTDSYYVSNILNAPSSVLSSLTSKFTVLDYSNNVVVNIASMETLANDGLLGAIDLTDTNGIPTLDLSAAQAITYAAVLGAIVGPYILESGSTVTGTAAGILGELDVLENQVLAGTVTSIVFTDTAAPELVLSYAQFSKDSDALLAITSSFTVAFTDSTPPVVSLDPGDVANYHVLQLVNRIASPFTVSLTGSLSSNQANDLVANLPTATLARPVDIVDYGNTVIGNLNSLETLAAAGKLGTIQLLDGGVDNLYLTAAQATTYAQVLGAITTPYTLSLTTSAAASASAVLSGQFTTVNVTDTAIDIINNLASLEQQALSGRLVGIAITGSSVLDLSAAQVMADLDALGRITGSYSITLTDSTTPTISIAEWQVSNANLNALNHITNAFSLTVTGPIRPVNAVRFVSINGAVLANLAPDSLQIRDSQANFFTSNLSALETLAADGKIASIDLRTSQAVINYTTAELGTDSMLLSKMIDPYLLAEDITVAQIGTTLTAGFNGFAIVDTAADITAGLAQIEQLALTGKLLSVEPTDANPIFTLSAATISADADALDAQNISAYPIILTDSGVPTITLQSYQLGYNMLNSILGAISGPYVLDIVGSVSADIASDFVVEVPGVLAYLATPLSVSDDAGDIKTDLDELEALAKLGMLHSVYVLDGATTPIVLTQPVATADQDALALFTGTNTVEVTCYLAGTRIATEHGDVAVEDLLVGERAITAGGALRPIVWIGKRSVDPLRHPDPQSVLPVCIRRDAFGSGLPHRDLFLSPDHAVYVEDVLIPIKYLINGTTVRQMPASGPITYFHVELDRHDVLLAEGLPAESYLDTGNRNTFENGGGAMALHPDFTIRAWEANGYAPLVVTGPELQAARRRLAPALTQPSPASAGEGFFPR